VLFNNDRTSAGAVTWARFLVAFAVVAMTTRQLEGLQTW
jgi:hypothetical protein